MKIEEEEHFRKELTQLLDGGFAPNLILLKEFDWKKAGVILEGLHFSAWILLGHIRARHNQVLEFMKDPGANLEIWQEAEWPKNYEPQTKEEWYLEIEKYQEEIEVMKKIVLDPACSLFKVHSNGKSYTDAAMIVLHHSGYHIGQLKAIGRQIGVW